jgi:putative oxidoreductase
MKQRSDVFALAGRVLLGLIFVVSGWGKLTAFAPVVASIANKGLPMPELLAGMAVVIELAGGIILLIGFKARWAALAFAVFLIVITPIFHSFWDVPAAQAMNQQGQFLKNMSILGGMLMIIAFGPGRFSIDKG